VVEKNRDTESVRLTPRPHLEVPHHLAPYRLGVANQNRCPVLSIPDSPVSTIGSVAYQDVLANPRGRQPGFLSHVPTLAKVTCADNEVGWEDVAWM
jgi:hypothetical protein